MSEAADEVRVTITVKVKGSAAEMAALLVDYFTDPNSDLDDAYGPSAYARSGYDGPYVTNVTATADSRDFHANEKSVDLGERPEGT